MIRFSLGHDDSHFQYASGEIRDRKDWWVSDAFENFAQCKKTAVEEVKKVTEPRKPGTRGPFLDNAGAWMSFHREFTEKEMKKSQEQSTELMKEDRASLEFLKRRGAVKMSWGTLKYICLPGGTDPRPRMKEN
jgi:hypothetical protein